MPDDGVTIAVPSQSPKQDGFVVVTFEESTVGDSRTNRSCVTVSEQPLAAYTYCIVFVPNRLMSGTKVDEIVPFIKNVPPAGVAVKLNGESPEHATELEVIDILEDDTRLIVKKAVSPGQLGVPEITYL